MDGWMDGWMNGWMDVLEGGQVVDDTHLARPDAGILRHGLRNPYQYYFGPACRAATVPSDVAERDCHLRLTFYHAAS